MFALHETCQAYFQRRLAEGWRCISLEGHNAVLLSPDGIRRKLNLTGDVETLRPNAPGDETNLVIGGDTPAATNWESVDEAVADDDTTFVKIESYDGIAEGMDLYNLPASSGLGTINSIKVYIRSYGSFGHAGTATGYASPRIKTNGTVYNGLLHDMDYTWQTNSDTWATNPFTGNPWTWDEIDALQIGVWMSCGGEFTRLTKTTQVYVEVDYTTPVVATNAASGITPTLGILNGTLEDDQGEVWDVRFQWGKTEDYGNDTDWQAGFSTGDTFTQLINTLEPGTLYHFRAQAKNSLGTVSGRDVAFWTLKPSVGKAYAFSRELHIKRATDVVDKASIDASAITTLADCRGLNLIEVPSSLTLTVEATYDAAATQGIKVHVRTSLTDHALGTHTGADGAAALTDAEAHFVVNELIGLTIKNLTDGSSGVITANTATTVTATLVGGTDNDWDSGDAYIIEGAGYDTEDWDSFTPAFGAGSSIRQTEHYDVDPVYLKVLVENLDGSEEVTDVKIIMAVGT